MAARLSQRIELIAADWALRRQGADANGVALGRRRIYILPTRYGVIFGSLVFAMLLGSLNYSASLGFALTFLLTGLGVDVMHHCHGNLLGAELSCAGARPVFAGGRAEFRIAINNGAGAPRCEIQLECGDFESEPVDLGAGQTKVVKLPVAAPARGYVALPRFIVATRYPANLFRAWTWLHMDARCLVYPAPAAPGREPPLRAGDRGLLGRSEQGDADFAGLRNAVPGDPPQRLAWKAFARSDELLVKQFAEGVERTCVFDWDALRDLPAEQRLSQLTRWCLDAAQTVQQRFGLRLPTGTISPDRGEAHLHECLKALALYEDTNA
jgi:uncharacterized protein (DUF58 family)